MERLGLLVRAGGFLTVSLGAYAWLAASPTPEGPPIPAQGAAPVPTHAAASFPEAWGAPPPVAASADGLILYGVSGGGRSLAAIIGSTAGGQRIVPVGKDYRPGLKLIGMGADYAILESAGRRARLELRRFGEAAGHESPRLSDSQRERGIEKAVLRNILKPVMSNGRIGGYALKGGESLPQLRRAGLQPGDIIVSVNGSQFDEERMGELAEEMANATRTEFLFIRNGKKMRGSA